MPLGRASPQKPKIWLNSFLWVQAEAYLSRLDPIEGALKLSHPIANYDRRSLGQLFGQLEQLMEDALGIKARPHHALCMHLTPWLFWLYLTPASNRASDN